MQAFIRQLQVDLDAFSHHDNHKVAVELRQVELPVCSVHHETTKDIRAQNTRDALTAFFLLFRLTHWPRAQIEKVKKTLSLFFADSICRAAKS